MAERRAAKNRQHTLDLARILQDALQISGYDINDDDWEIDRGVVSMRYRAADGQQLATRFKVEEVRSDG